MGTKPKYLKENRWNDLIYTLGQPHDQIDSKKKKKELEAKNTGTINFDSKTPALNNTNL